MIDVHHFCEALQKYGGDGRLKELAAKVDEAAAKVVVQRPKSEKFTGVNLFCYPIDPDEQRFSRMASNASDTVYRSIALSAQTQWNEIALAAKPEMPEFLKKLRQSIATRAANGALLPGAAARLRRQGVSERLQIDTLVFIAQALNTLDQNSDDGSAPGFDVTTLVAALRNMNLSDKGGNLGSDKGGNLDSDKGGNLQTDFRLRPAGAGARGRTNGSATA
jgi:hypothetical protein